MTDSVLAEGPIFLFLGIRQSYVGSKSSFHHLLAVWGALLNLSELFLSFFLCKIGNNITTQCCGKE